MKGACELEVQSFPPSHGTVPRQSNGSELSGKDPTSHSGAHNLGNARRNADMMLSGAGGCGFPTAKSAQALSG